MKRSVAFDGSVITQTREFSVFGVFPGKASRIGDFEYTRKGLLVRVTCSNVLFLFCEGQVVDAVHKQQISAVSLGIRVGVRVTVDQGALNSLSQTSVQLIDFSATDLACGLMCVLSDSDFCKIQVSWREAQIDSGPLGKKTEESGGQTEFTIYYASSSLLIFNQKLLDGVERDPVTIVLEKLESEAKPDGVGRANSYTIMNKGSYVHRIH